MTESILASLRLERSRLLDAWRTADNSDKMSILVRIEDIDERLKNSKNPAAERKTRARRFFRR